MSEALRLLEEAYLGAARQFAPLVPLVNRIDTDIAGHRAEVSFYAVERPPVSARYDENGTMCAVQVHRHTVRIGFDPYRLYGEIILRHDRWRGLQPQQIIEALYSDMAEDCAMQFSVMRAAEIGGDGHHQRRVRELHMLQHHARWDFYNFTRDTTQLRQRLHEMQRHERISYTWADWADISNRITEIVAGLSPEARQRQLQGEFDGDWLGIGAAMDDAILGVDPSAEANGIALLKEHLTPAQLADYEKTKSFTVTGSRTGKTYRIRHGRQQNVYELDKRGKVVRGICFLPRGNLCAGDCMTAQKIALETDEDSALRVAIPFQYGNDSVWFDEGIRFTGFDAGVRRPGVVRFTDFT